MKNWRSALVGLVAGIFLTIGTLGLAAPITGPTAGSFPDFVAAANARFFNWMSFVDQGEMQFLGPNSFFTSGSKVYLILQDSTGTQRTILTGTTTPP